MPFGWHNYYWFVEVPAPSQGKWAVVYLFVNGIDVDVNVFLFDFRIFRWCAPSCIPLCYEKNTTRLELFTCFYLFNVICTITINQYLHKLIQYIHDQTLNSQIQLSCSFQSCCILFITQGLELWCLTPLSTIFQLYRDGQL
jgi:hypothetical protein